MNNELKPCPFCGSEVEIKGGPENWIPTWYDPDSGGDPYYINCKCGCVFDIGSQDGKEFTDVWNRRAEEDNFAYLCTGDVMPREEWEKLVEEAQSFVEKARDLLPDALIIPHFVDLENKQNDSWIITENGCVITCPSCGERLELCYPDGTEIRYLPHCPWCGKRLEK